ncbi:hypothetical protein B0T16DRAFT_453900 [Cercophora newfieldiana]|uniref:Uncharacterized protein n=1 Tax=Cercophora newfieldiana TaxID=92897 RepID=A0AA39YI42_9PEZI|nr:hypothetical protein B0T16DRAFT_453900 [Cercophora newfieldiana]
MTAVTIDLGQIEVSNKHSLSSLTLSSSISIVLPPAWPAATTAAELCDASSEGEIWISKAGSCLVEVQTLLDGEGAWSSGFDIGSVFSELVADCTIWEEIGLELRTGHLPLNNPHSDHRSKRSYFLHHPDLSSDMIAPEHIPIARFQGLTIEVNFRPETTQHKRQANSQESLLGSAAEAAVQPPGLQNGHAYSLRRNPRPTSRALAAQEDTEIQDRRARPKPVSSAPTQDGGTAEMTMLLEVALRKLIGIRGVSPGIKTAKRGESVPLIDIAPAVWNQRYLQSMTAHTQVIPVITEGIARLSNSRSLALREKVARLRYSPAQQGDADEQAEGGSVQEGVKSLLWTLCQTTVHADPIAKSGSRRNQDPVPNGSQLMGENDALWEHEQRYLETFGSQPGRIDNTWNPGNPYLEHQSFPEFDSGVLAMGAEMNEKSHYRYVERQSSVNDIQEGEGPLGEYDELPGEDFGSQMGTAHHPFSFSPPADQQGGTSDFGGPKEDMGMVERSSFSHRVDSLLDQDVALPPTSAGETDGSVDESEGDYFYVDAQGNYYQIEKQSFGDEGSEGYGGPDFGGLAEGHSMGPDLEHQWPGTETLEQY